MKLSRGAVEERILPLRMLNSFDLRVSEPETVVCEVHILAVLQTLQGVVVVVFNNRLHNHLQKNVVKWGYPYLFDEMCDSGFVVFSHKFIFPYK